MRIKKALIVDDSNLARMTLARLLKARHIEVEEAASVQSALKVLSSLDIDLIFMDISMPDIDGFAGIRAIRSVPQYRHIACVMYSSDLSETAQQKALAAGVSGYLHKPATSKSLDAVLMQLINKVQPEERLNRKEDNAASKAPTAAMQQAHVSINALDTRTKNLARIISKEKKTLESSLQAVTAHMHSLDSQLENLKHNNKRYQENSTHQLSQIQQMREKMRSAMTIAIIAGVLAVVAVTLMTLMLLGVIQIR